MNNLKYVIIGANEVNSIDFSKIKETSAETLRYSVNDGGQYTFVKYEGDIPDFLSGKTEYNQIEMLSILNDPNGIWYTESDF